MKILLRRYSRSQKVISDQSIKFIILKKTESKTPSSNIYYNNNWDRVTLLNGLDIPAQGSKQEKVNKITVKQMNGAGLVDSKRLS